MNNENKRKELKVDELKAYASVKVSDELKELKERIDKEPAMTDILSDKIHEIILKTKLEEEKMILVYGHCYTAMLEVLDEEGKHVGMEALVSYEDPRNDDRYKDRIMNLMKTTHLNFPPRLEVEMLKR